MAKTKGIRISALAKEMGVKSKDVLEKLRAEGLGESAPNHQSTVNRGLEMSIRGWFEGGGTATAVETATTVKRKKVAKKATPKAPAARASDVDDESAPPRRGNLADAVDEARAPAAGQNGTNGSPRPAAAAAEPSTRQTPDPAPPAAEPARPVAEASTQQTPDPAAPAAEAPKVQPAPAKPAAEPEAPSEKVTPKPVLIDLKRGGFVREPSQSPGQAPTGPGRAAAASRQQPAANQQQAPANKPRVIRSAAPASLRRPAEAEEPQLRPRITLDRQGETHSEPQGRPRVSLEDQLAARRAAEQAKPVEIAKPLDKLKPAEIKGPKLIRQEAPEPDAGPRRPRPRVDRDAGPGGSRFGPTAKAGGGVKVTPGRAAEAPGDKDKKGRPSLSARRRGDRRGEAMEKLREFTEADQIARRDALASATATRSGFSHRVGKAARRGQGVRAGVGGAAEGPIQVEEPITVKSFSAATGLRAQQILRLLMRQGQMTTINAGLDPETAEMIAMEFGLELEIVESKGAEELLLERYEQYESAPEAMKPRPPVVTILGHVDHGKTSLLDKIRNARVQAGEAGGITQHTGAFTVHVEREGQQKEVTFIDTPGHQAFTAMRARGADMTDIVVLVIDAAQGAQPQTVESINHARAAGKTIVVALNKIDLPDANPDMVLGQLAANELNPAEWGGDTEVVRTSAQTGRGIDDLLEVLDLQAELMDLQADPAAPARGTVIEAEVKPGLGAVATVLVQQGTLKVGDPVVVGRSHGKVRALRDSSNKNLREAGPSMPVVVSGLDAPPEAGDKLYRVETIDVARDIAADREELFRKKDLASQNQVSLESIMGRMAAEATATINLIVKGDVAGSIETLVATLPDLNTDEVRVRVLHSGVGAIGESDIELAAASEAVVIGFHVGIDEKARNLAEQRGVEVRGYQVIYEIFDDLKMAMSGMLAPDIKEVYKGTAEVRDLFKVSRVGTIAGCFVTDGVVGRTNQVRLVRDGRPVTDGLRIESLRRVKDDAREVKQGLECGIKLAGYDDLKIGDKIECYVQEEVARTLD